MRILRRACAPFTVAVALALLLTSCTGTDGSDLAEGQSISSESEEAQSTPTEPQLVDEGVEPDGEPFAILPESVDTAVPDVSDPGSATDVDGREVLPPVGFDDAIKEPTSGAVVWLESFSSVENAGSRPGEVGGPAIQLDVLIHNSGDKPLDLATLVVSATYGPSRTPAENVLTNQSRPLTGAVEPGQTIRGTLLFVVPKDSREDVQLSVDLASQAQVVVFEGSTLR